MNSQEEGRNRHNCFPLTSAMLTKEKADGQLAQIYVLFGLFSFKKCINAF
jgi:hypothetical protein